MCTSHDQYYLILKIFFLRNSEIRKCFVQLGVVHDVVRISEQVDSVVDLPLHQVPGRDVPDPVELVQSTLEPIFDIFNHLDGLVPG